MFPSKVDESCFGIDVAFPLSVLFHTANLVDFAHLPTTGCRLCE